LVVLTARIETSVSERRELGQALLAWASAARREPGTLVARVYEDIEAPAAFCLVAQWPDQPAIEAHIRGAEFGAVLGALELLARSPHVSITQLGDVSGGDAWRTIRRLRSGARTSEQLSPAARLPRPGEPGR
jgi:quinol monooxygenase YgiN